ncbi:unnamed protein product [Caenorhabditis auriculariae]|uniref:Uncharacterized protein n=1 Tax=Caenorhabditis auriculariae TaxID=2777116 RepID=A0A8S1HR67_9PELO|nr:unnamed protein product [Caenorhabditis auriculariae]
MSPAEVPSISNVKPQSAVIMDENAIWRAIAVGVAILFLACLYIFVRHCVRTRSDSRRIRKYDIVSAKDLQGRPALMEDTDSEDDLFGNTDRVNLVKSSG